MKSSLVELFSNSSLSSEEIERIVKLRNYFEGVAEQIKEHCLDTPERVVALRLLEESLSCSVRCINPEKNPFLQNNLTLRGKYIKTNPTRWEKKMKDAGLSTPYQLHAKD